MLQTVPGGLSMITLLAAVQSRVADAQHRNKLGWICQEACSDSTLTYLSELLKRHAAGPTAWTALQLGNADGVLVNALGSLQLSEGIRARPGQLKMYALDQCC